MAPLGQTADDPRAGRDGTQVVVEHGGGVAHREAPALGGPPLVPGLRRAEAVDDEAVRQQLLQLVLHCRRQGSAARADRQERRRVPPPRFGGEGVGQGPAHGVADDRHAVDSLALHQVPGPPGVEAGAVEQDRLLGLEQGAHRDPLAGAVHERRGDEVGERTSHRHLLDQLVGRRHRLAGVVAPAEEGEEGVLVAPHHPFGHSGGAAGVDDVAVVVGAPREVTVGRGRRQRLLVVGPDAKAGAVERGVELGPVHEYHEVGVVEEVAQLVVDVAKVDVHRRGPQLEGGHHGLDPLGAVVGMDADVAVPAHACLGQVVGQAGGPLVELTVGQAAVAADEALAVGDGVGHPLEQVSQVPTHVRWTAGSG